MWEDQGPDPGGTSKKSLGPQELSDLKDENEQQLVLIAQLKEMLRKDHSSVSQYKVEEYVNSLNRARAKRSRQNKGDSSATSGSTTASGNIDANKKGRVNLLRQQLEENKARLAERGKSQKGIEEMVSQLQAQLRGSQTLVSSNPLNVPLVEAKTLDYNENTPQKELYNILLTKERKITELLNKSKTLEGNVLDLQENIKEKDSVIDARTKAITLMTDSLSKKGKDTLDTLEETKDQMRQMQENFVTLEAEMKARQLMLLNDLKLKNFEISELGGFNSQLEKEKLELEQKLSGRSSQPVNAIDSFIVDDLKREIERLQLENKSLFEKIGTPDKTATEEFQKKFERVIQENDDNILKISQLELQLQEALSTIRTREHILNKSEEDNKLIEENMRLQKDNFDHLSKVRKLEKQLEELSSKLKIEENKDDANMRVIEENLSLAKENSEHLSKIRQLETQLEDASTDFKLLKNTGMGSSSKSGKGEIDEVAREALKLKKQLDESNKSMIKMRAVQKGKIKELNKKLDQFRKMSDPNALIAQLQNEIGILNEKVAELEDEKGNLQLKMVDSTTSSKEDSTDVQEEIKQLKGKLNQTEQELNEKDKVIEILETEVLALKADLKHKSEEEIRISSQVSSEMASICYEEQIETLELVKNKLLEQLNTTHAEKENLMLELELAKKKKQDLNAKLDSYIQENMELIDKLEKLSAEKVSSAESIEIVEGLTQQEKLELAAYQKHINPDEPLKCPDDDTNEPSAEVNESVLQLSEDTADLLQKIEMFTQERKEVMQKMEALKEENITLTSKVKEIENNRDILEETYEQLQNEKDVILNEKQELSDLLEKIQKNEILEKKEEQSATILVSELKDLQIKYEALIQENDKHKRILKELDSMIQEKYDLETRLRDVVENNTILDTKLNSNLDEINAYQLTIEENKSQLINSAETINKLQNQLEERENDIQELHINISELNSVISELQCKQNKFEEMETELRDLKSTLTNQITQAGDYESEIAQNNDTIKKLNDELVGMNRRILELENELELKDSEIEKLAKDINNKDEIIRNLQTDIDEKDRSFRIVSEDIKGKYLGLKEQLDSNDETLQKRISELTNKNKEQLEKMKKLAANLKKKSNAYQELEEHYKVEKEKLVFATQALEDSESRLRNKLKETAELDQLREQLVIVEHHNADQQHYIQELKHKYEKAHETSLQQEMSVSLHEEIDTSFSQQNISDDKIREMQLLLETNESDLIHHKERIDRLQEDARKLQEAKYELEIMNAELVDKLNLTSNSFKEKALLEDQLELRLAEVTANDEVLTKNVQEMQREREELLQKNQEHEELIKRLKIKLKKAHDKVTELKTVQINLQDLERSNQELRTQVASLEDNQRHIQNENESLQRRNLSDYEKIEADYQMQLEELLKAKNDLTTDNEKLLERVRELEDREQELALESNEFKIRIDQLEKYRFEVKDELESEKSQNQEFGTRFDNLNNELDNAAKQLIEVRKQLESVTSEKNCLTSSLEKVLAESNDLKESLQISKVELQTSSEMVAKLTMETEKLRQEILALEFVKSSLEASCESAHKLEIKEELLQQTENLSSMSSIPSFRWPDEPQLDKHPAAGLSLFGGFGQQQTTEEQVGDAAAADLKMQLNSSNQELQSALHKVDNLQSEVDRLKEEIHVLQFAKSSLEASYESSQKPVDPVREVTPNTLEVSVDYIPPAHQPQLFSPVVENGREALLKKIKTLEFLLFNVDKEKEIALDQCTEMVNELTQIIYNTANAPQTQEVPKSDLESQILSEETVNNLTLIQTDFAPTNKNCGEQATPVNEEIIEPKKAYICFDDDLDSQIMSERDIAGASSSKKELHTLEYEKVDKSFGEQQQPVVEPLVQPKHAYLCYTKDDKPQSLEAFEENDDGWGWGPEEARLEEEHMSTLENIPQVKSLLLEIQQLKENIRVLQVERDNHLEEIKQLQIKSGKLIKKCKELKIKNDQASTGKKQDDGGFFDLNETIQEELKIQVLQLEKKLRELVVEHEREKAEKNNLLKRVDVLTSANDRMTEMKEIQDSEVLRWQRKHQEALQKLQQHEWGSDGFGETLITDAPQPSTSGSVEDQNSNIKDLEDTIKELSLDNDELQALLEEQTIKRLEAEKNKNSGNEEELAELRSVKETLHKELNEIKSKAAELQAEVSRVESVVRDKDFIIGDLQSHLEQVLERKSELDQTVGQLHNDLASKTVEIQRLDKSIETQEMKSQVEQLNSVISEQNETINNLNQEKSLLQESNVEVNDKLKNSEEAAKKALAEKERGDLEYQITLQNLQGQIAEVQNGQAIISELQGRIKEIEALGTENESLVEQLLIKSRELEEKQRVLDELQIIVAENNHTDELLNKLNNAAKEIKELKADLVGKDMEIQRLLEDVQNKEQEFQERVNALVNELNETWQLQVDQRGADVAESWKMHLEMIEKDYKSDVLELEEKCNILVNENNELRKNVDQEIRHEVDKMSALQQQISNLQQTVNSLNQAIQSKDKQIENNLSLETELQTLKRENAEMDSKLASINIIIETTQKQFDEKREVIEEIVSILEKHALSPISYEKQDIVREFERQLGLVIEKNSEISVLSQSVQELEAKLNRISGEKGREIIGLNQVIEDLEKDLSVIHEKESEIVRLSSELNNTHLEKENLGMELEKLQHEHSNCLEFIKDCNKKINDYYSSILSLQQSLEEKNGVINDLNQRLLQMQEGSKNDSNKEMESLSRALSEIKEDYLVLQGSLSECQNKLHEATQQLVQKTQELQTTNESIVQYQQNQSYYDLENNRLKQLLDQREKEYNNSLEMLKNNQLADVQRHYDELLSNRDIDINTLRGQVRELVDANQSFDERLNQELGLKQQLEQHLDAQTQLVNEDTKQLEELKLIIEDQVAKIEILKKELFEKSSQYDSLIAEMDVGRLPVTRQPLASAAVSPSAEGQSRQYYDDDLSEPVSRAELDLALYMLHQRDVRCEELTMELTQLLEERDTLQLRLSNAIREKEEFRRSAADNSLMAPSAASLTEVSPNQSRSSAIFLAASGTELAKDPLESEHNLATKLSELKNVGYKKDKTFVDEQDARRLQQLAIMQQHIKEASKLPPEAAAKLVDASYTLSRDVQSPSKVLLNWLWGKNPPKANDS